jgi:hypothetical protein
VEDAQGVGLIDCADFGFGPVSNNDFLKHGYSPKRKVPKRCGPCVQSPPD